MSNYKNNSLEWYLVMRFLLIAAVILGLSWLLLLQFSWSSWDSAIILGVIASVQLWLMSHWFKKIISAFDRGLLHLESVQAEDYNQFAKSDFAHGQVAKFHAQLKQLSLYLANQKSRYDQHVFLVYQLIDQLDTPILVFNKNNKLSYANGAFSQLYAQPWQMYRNASPKLLGLVQHENRWSLAEKEQQWQVSQSQFIDDGETHQLLVFTNIETALRDSQQAAWHQIIRVMSHEIRNSLTPVSSLAEGLATRAEKPRDKQALDLISERCHHLQDFVSRYSSLSQQFNLNPSHVEIQSLKQRLTGLFNQHTLIIESSNIQWLWADQTFIEQVLINLIKNAIEASATTITLHFSQHQSKAHITLTDNGHGFANLDNLFVPLFTTKPEGQGIGLSFCRNIITQHNGQIELTNNSDHGVTVAITLPIKT
ncbi:PAS domain-containing sensor histidine kinase [Psychrobium sp. 1_MG-2023]|uniref:sensor histidine kinase n=1 Tax=Psychrobium sp. 1_MG-2023 TaxID=3062624 RepID=UPI000C326345|nr:ATP-binding protein [Psychrobium sp. 1_MG-2023]MDP2562737.1 ATP-binding protein [Psychrobium sp. 1_MG-2023]PKF54254.1 sensor histidine kinase [Alteromonadales bacterium alter-6D02]